MEGRGDVCGGVDGVVAVDTEGGEGVGEGLLWWWVGVREVWVGWWWWLFGHLDGVGGRG